MPEPQDRMASTTCADCGRFLYAKDGPVCVDCRAAAREREKAKAEREREKGKH